MKSKNPFIIAVASVLALSSAPMFAATFTWDGGGGDGNISTAANWNPDGAPSATGNSLVFAGTTNLSVNNDSITSLGSNAINFAAGAGSFNIGGNAITVGAAANDNFVTKVSTNDQTISANINLAGGGRDRTIIMTGGGTLTLSGNVNFANDWMFPTSAAGTIVLSGSNSGDGKGGVLNAGTNTSRAMMRNNVSGTSLILGSDTALGNSGSGDIGAGTANLRGLVANQNLTIGTQGGNRNLSGSTFIINTANVTFNGTDQLTIGNLINQGGNRDFVVSSSGQVTVGSGISLSHDQTGRNLYVNLSGTGGMVVDGKLYDTFHSGGVTTGQSTFRKAGTGTMTLNGDSAGYNGLITVEGGTLKIGHANALGATGSTSGTTLTGNATLDLNGNTSGESLTFNNTGNQLVNSSVSSAGLSADATLNANLTVNATGDITVTRLIGTSVRIITKTGTGTLTTNGTSHNNLSNWDIQQGTVVLANTSGLGADRGVALNGGTLRLSGANSNLINDSESFVINSGSFDLNGKAEAVASIGGNGGNITNSAVGPAHLYVGGGTGGSSSATYGGVIGDGAGTMQVTKEGTGTQTLSGLNTYSGATTISNGTLALAATGSIDNTSGVSLGINGTFDISAKSGGYAVANLTGSGTVIGALTVSTELAIGNSPGAVDFDDLTLGASSVYTYELFGGGVSADLANISGNLSLDTGASLDLVQLGSYTVGNKFTLFAYQTGNLTGTFNGLNDGATFADAGGNWQINYFDNSAGLNGGTGTSFVTITAVPEPGAALLGGLGLLALFRRRRG
ncbi:MAG: autotransporter-associated beta strand repeat-containing protein [Verrucomicrobiae bacterium]|nr:autotransporter-associated beta strand repeat-containing protein [Verrucomicrobiae bacterium]